MRNQTISLFASFLMSLAAHADAIPPRKELNPLQALLVGTWQEENWTQSRWGLGHSQSKRTLIVGNENLTIASLNAVLPSNEFSTRAISGAWTAKRKNSSTVEVKVDQGGGRGTTLTLTLDGADAFLLSDEELMVAPSRFVRSGKSPIALR